jgi:hypothetical protein
MQATLLIYVSYITEWHFEPHFPSLSLKLHGYYLFINK